MGKFIDVDTALQNPPSRRVCLVDPDASFFAIRGMLAPRSPVFKVPHFIFESVRPNQKCRYAVRQTTNSTPKKNDEPKMARGIKCEHNNNPEFKRIYQKQNIGGSGAQAGWQGVARLGGVVINPKFVTNPGVTARPTTQK